MTDILKCLEGTKIVSMEDNEGTIEICFGKSKEADYFDYEFYTECPCRVTKKNRVLQRYAKKVLNITCKKVIFNEIGDIEIILQNNVKIQVFANKADAVLWQFEDNINFKSYLKTPDFANYGGDYEYI